MLWGAFNFSFVLCGSYTAGVYNDRLILKRLDHTPSQNSVSCPCSRGPKVHCDNIDNTHLCICSAIVSVESHCLTYRRSSRLKHKAHNCRPVPLSINEWQQPPAWSCCSSTRTFLPTRARRAAVVRPPMPLPITIASSSSGTFLAVKPCLRTLSRATRSEMKGWGGRRWSRLNGSGPIDFRYALTRHTTSGRSNSKTVSATLR